MLIETPRRALAGISLALALTNAPLAAAEFRSIDGTGNNVANVEWGSVDIQLLRPYGSSYYADGISAPAGASRPSARAVSNAVSDASVHGLSVNAMGLTNMFWQWGQFIDHDMDLTGGQSPAESFNIAVPTGDPYFDPAATGAQVISLNRSQYDPATGVPGAPREQTNGITAFIDGSNIYGSDAARATALRSGIDGKLATTAHATGDLLPYNTGGFDNANGGPTPGDQLFLAGDVRANEQIGLIALHTLFMREHNRLAEEIKAANPGLGDEGIYQRARRLVGAEIQAVTYNEFLPALLGPNTLGAYGGYDSGVNPGIANEFSTAAYRFGHSALTPYLARYDENGDPIPEGPVALRNAFFSPNLISGEGGIDPVLRGLAGQLMEDIDTVVVDDIRNFLFGPPGAGGFDLAALNIQRGRDHGLPSYNQARIDYGFAPVLDFSDITSNPALQAALAGVYGDVANVDLWVGGLAEEKLEGAMLGELFAAIIADQFERLRAGDRFWYEYDLDPAELAALDGVRLSDIVRWNSEIGYMEASVFHMEGFGANLAVVVSEPAAYALFVCGMIVLFGVPRRHRICRNFLQPSDKRREVNHISH